MTTHAANEAPYETMLTRYPLPEACDVVVAPGDAVKAGDVIASVTIPPQWGRNARDGRKDDAAKGAHANVRALPIIARHPGTVSAITDDSVILAVAVRHVPFAYVFGRRPTHVALGAADGPAAPLPAGGHIQSVPYIGDGKALLARLPKAGDILIAGAVSDDFGWEMHAQGLDARLHAAPSTCIVLIGPGTPECGAHAIRGLFAPGGRAAIIDHLARTMAIVFDAPPTAVDVTRDAMLCDPAHWCVPVTHGGDMRLSTTESGLHVWERNVRSPSLGAMWVPANNLLT